jgi:hypothetical protein
MIMNDKTFLKWLADRLVNVYGENPSVDFVTKLSSIAAATEPTRNTPNNIPYSVANNVDINSLHHKIVTIFGQYGVRIVGHLIAENEFGDDVLSYAPHSNDLHNAYDQLLTELEALPNVQVTYDGRRNVVKVRASINKTEKT